MKTNENDIAIFKPYPSRICGNYVYLPEYENYLRKHLLEKNLIFITALPGMGKTQLARSYIRNYFYKSYKEACEINSYLSSKLTDNNSSKSLVDHIFHSDFSLYYNEDDFGDLWDILSYKNETSILLIDMPIINDDFLVLVNDILSTLKIHIIITTISYVDPNTYQVLHLEEYSFNSLKSIFTSKCNGNHQFTDMEFTTLFKILDNNPMMVSLVAQSLSKDSNNLITKEKLLDGNDWLWQTYGLPQINFPYTNEIVSMSVQKGYTEKPTPNKSRIKYKLTLLKHALTLFYHFPKTILENYVPVLCVWAGTSISENCLIKYAGLSNEAIKSLHKIGLLKYTDEQNKIVKMNPLFYQIFWYFYNSHQEKALYINPDFSYSYSLDLRFYIHQLIRAINAYLDKNEKHMNFTDIDNLLQKSLPKIHYHLTSFSSDKYYKSNEQTSFYWNQMLIDIIQFYLDRGNTRIPEKFIQKLFINTNKHGKKGRDFTSPERYIIDILNTLSRMISINFDPSKDSSDIEKYLMSIADYLKKAKREFSKDFYSYSLIKKCINLLADSILCHYHRSIQMIFPYCQKQEFSKFTKKLSSILDNDQIIFTKKDERYTYHKFALQCDLALCENNIHVLFSNFPPDPVFCLETNLKIIMQIMNTILIFYLNLENKQKEFDKLKEYLRNENCTIMKGFSSAMSYDTIFLYFTTRINYMNFESFYIKESPEDYYLILKEFCSEIPLYKKYLIENFSINSKNKEKVIEQIDSFLKQYEAYQNTIA